ncbi:MAG TPA: enoyl-CoA hydratase, partial [Pseudomonas pachastrellae]|nr:enoyl-CoA hydratase [Halopseudomonas pachastrellae]
LLLGEEISGTRASEIGLANQALPAGQAVLDAARAAALRIAELPPSSVQLTKRLISSGVSRTADEVMETEGEHFAKLLSGAEAKEALTAFMEKRKPVFN